MSNRFQKLIRLPLVLSACLMPVVLSSSAHAQFGSIVYDPNNYWMQIQQWAQQLQQMQQQYQQMTAQLQQAQQQFQSMNGNRGLATVLNDPQFQNYLPQGWQPILSASGINLQTSAAQNVQNLMQAYNTASNRISQIQGLLNQAGQTQDPKGIAEIQARIQGETAMLQNEAMKMQLYKDTLEAAQKANERANMIIRAKIIYDGLQKRNQAAGGWYYPQNNQ
jgi:type IV secretion system protein VirB5